MVLIRSEAETKFKDLSMDDSMTTETNLNRKIAILEENLDAMRIKVLN